jgi:DtxR family Mn-dependent transcriptional regulator
MMYSRTEEEYLKAIYHLSAQKEQKVGTSELADHLSNKPASVTDMIKKLAAKELVYYKKSYGVSLTPGGEQEALKIIRKHRLWETFLVNTLKFGWEEVHEIADELEHIQSEILINKLEAFLEYPRFDPHGDPIPNREGQMPEAQTLPLSEVEAAREASFVSVAIDQASFLQYLDRIQLQIGDVIRVQEREAFDGSLRISVHDKDMHISRKVAENIFVRLL